MKSKTTLHNNQLVSADGKAFSAQYILDVVTKLATRFARAKGHSMSDWDISNLASEALCEKVIPQFDSYESHRPLEPWLWTIVFHEGCDLLRKENEEQYRRYLNAIPDEEKRECMRLVGEEKAREDLVFPGFFVIIFIL